MKGLPDEVAKWEHLQWKLQVVRSNQREKLSETGHATCCIRTTCLQTKTTMHCALKRLGEFVTLTFWAWVSHELLIFPAVFFRNTVLQLQVNLPPKVTFGVKAFVQHKDGAPFKKMDSRKDQFHFLALSFENESQWLAKTQPCFIV